MTRGSTLAAAVIGGLALLGVSVMIHAGVSAYAARERIAGMRSLVGALGLTDITLFTEARYTRHMSMADQHSPFQDAPMAMEHFPAGSLVAPRVPQAGRVERGDEGQ